MKIFTEIKIDITLYYVLYFSCVVHSLYIHIFTCGIDTCEHILKFSHHYLLLLLKSIIILYFFYIFFFYI